MGTAAFPLMFGGFGSSASFDSPAWQRAGMPAKQVKAVIISLWNKSIFGSCFVTAAERFHCPVERLAPVVHNNKEVKPWLSIFWSPSPGCARTPQHCSQVSVLAAAEQVEKNIHTRKKLKFSAARGRLCGAGKFTACRLVTLFLGQALCKSSSMGVWGVGSPRVHPGPWRSFPEVCPCSLLHGEAREGL